jgi:hypothetical protein
MGANGYNSQQSGDLRATLTISQSEASNGTTRMLNLPDGRTIQITIPPNTQAGQEIRLERQGQSVTPGGPLGALILTIALARDENFGSHPFPLGGSDTPTQFSAPPPPAQASYPGIPSAHNFTNYPPQGQTVPPIYNNPQNAARPAVPPTNAPYYGGQSPVVSTQNRRSNRRPLIATVIIAVLAALVIAGSLLYYSAVYQPQQQHAQATKTANSQATGTSQVATAQVSATDNAQLNASATAQAKPRTDYATITAKAPDLLNDPLTNPDTNNWDTNANCSFKGGSYHVTASQKGFFFDCAARNTKFSHFLFQVKMTFVQGDYGGILFRADLTNNKFYLLRIDRATSGYDLYSYTGKKATDAKRLLTGTSSALNAGLNESNQIAVLARDQGIRIYFNSTYIDSVNDATVDNGAISLFAEDNEVPAEVHFQQAQVWNA